MAWGGILLMFNCRSAVNISSLAENITGFLITQGTGIVHHSHGFSLIRFDALPIVEKNSVIKAGFGVILRTILTKQFDSFGEVGSR